MTVYVKRNQTIIIKARNYQHAIAIFASKIGYDLEYAIRNDGYTIEVLETN